MAGKGGDENDTSTFDSFRLWLRTAFHADQDIFASIPTFPAFSQVFGLLAHWPLFSPLSLLSELCHLLIGLCVNFISTMWQSNVDGGEDVLCRCLMTW